MLESFRVRSFRFQWAADAFATWASEMENLVLGWYILVDTGSPFLVGLVGALRFGGTLLSPFYGVIADRFDRRTLLIVLRLLHALQAAALMALAVSGTLLPWHAFAITAVGGLMRMAENVVRQSLMADIVPAGALMNAVGLSRTTMDVAKIAGAVAGAGLLARLGLGPAYVVITLCFVLSTVLIFGVTPGRERAQSSGASGTSKPSNVADPVGAPRSPAAPAASNVAPATRRFPESPYRTLRSGLGYMRRSPTIVAIMFLAFLVNLTVFPLSNGLMPVVARDAFAFGPAGLALLLTAVSVGAVAGSLLLTALTTRVRQLERTMLIAIAAWHVLLLVFVQLAGLISGSAISESAAALPIALVVLAAYGASSSASMVTMSAVLLGTADVAFRGRVMGVRMMAVYGLPMGLLLGGVLAERLGILPALNILGFFGLLMTALAAFRWPALLRGTKASAPGPLPAPVA